MPKFKNTIVKKQIEFVPCLPQMYTGIKLRFRVWHLLYFSNKQKAKVCEYITFHNWIQLFGYYFFPLLTCVFPSSYNLQKRNTWDWISLWWNRWSYPSGWWYSLLLITYHLPCFLDIETMTAFHTCWILCYLLSQLDPPLQIFETWIFFCLTDL